MTRGESTDRLKHSSRGTLFPDTHTQGQGTLLGVQMYGTDQVGVDLKLVRRDVRAPTSWHRCRVLSHGHHLGEGEGEGEE